MLLDPRPLRRGPAPPVDGASVLLDIMTHPRGRPFFLSLSLPSTRVDSGAAHTLWAYVMCVWKSSGALPGCMEPRQGRNKRRCVITKRGCHHQVLIVVIKGQKKKSFEKWQRIEEFHTHLLDGVLAAGSMVGAFGGGRLMLLLTTPLCEREDEGWQ